MFDFKKMFDYDKKIIPYSIENFNGPKIIEYKMYHDYRGHFEELYKISEYNDIPKILQWNHSRSKAGVLRGMHFQWNPFMGKLVICLTGSISDAIIDIRKNSPTFGDSYMVELNEDVGEALWVPPGFAHGFFARTDCNVIYGCSGEYNGSCEAGINFKQVWQWDTPVDLNEVITMTDKDRNAQSLSDWEKNPNSNVFIYEELKA